MKRRQIWKDRTIHFLHCGDQIVALTISKTGKDNAAMGLYFYKMLGDFNSSWI